MQQKQEKYKDIHSFNPPTTQETAKQPLFFVLSPRYVCRIYHWFRHAAPGLQRSLCLNSLTLALWTYLQSFVAEWCCKKCGWNGRTPEFLTACRWKPCLSNDDGWRFDHQLIVIVFVRDCKFLKTPPPSQNLAWSLCHGAVHRQKKCCFLCWAQSDCHKCGLMSLFPKKRWKNSLRRRVEAFDSTTDSYWHVIHPGYQMTSHDITWRLVLKMTTWRFGTLERLLYEILRSYESRHLRISLAGVLWAEVLQRLQMQWFFQVPWQHQ